ncbi:hypothetical protein EDB85DRAFT_1930681, partial [Lactarius pseudohatsudake]
MFSLRLFCYVAWRVFPFSQCASDPSISSKPVQRAAFPAAQRSTFLLRRPQALVVTSTRASRHYQTVPCRSPAALQPECIDSCAHRQTAVSAISYTQSFIFTVVTYR